MAALSRCIACGVCDAHFEAYDAIARTVLRAPSDLVLAHSRASPDWNALLAPVAQLERGDLARLEALCPARIPFAALARLVRARAAAVEPVEGSLPAGPRTPRHDPG